MQADKSIRTFTTLTPSLTSKKKAGGVGPINNYSCEMHEEGF